MKIESIPISSLQPDPSNVRKHSEKNIAAIKGSLAKFGQQKPIVVGENDVVIAGNGTLAAAQQLGWEKIDVVRTNLAGVEAVAFAIADNRTGELAEWDEGLGDVLKALDKEMDLAAIGFDDADLAGLMPDFDPCAPTTNDTIGITKGDICQAADQANTKRNFASRLLSFAGMVRPSKNSPQRSAFVSRQSTSGHEKSQNFLPLKSVRRQIHCVGGAKSARPAHSAK